MSQCVLANFDSHKLGLSLSKDTACQPDPILSTLEESNYSVTQVERTQTIQRDIISDRATYQNSFVGFSIDALRKRQRILALRRNEILSLPKFRRFFRKSELVEIEHRLDCVELEIVDQLNPYPKLIRRMERIEQAMDDRLNQILEER